MASRGVTINHLRISPQRHALRRWQAARSWARLIQEAEALWQVEALAMHRVAAEELGCLLQEVPPAQRRRVNRWLLRFGVLTRLNP